MSFGFIRIHLPFYMSWENPKKLKIKNWYNYLRPEVNLDINKIIRKMINIGLTVAALPELSD